MFLADPKVFKTALGAHANGLSVADVDGDGAFEVLVAVERGGNLVLKWRDGALTNIADSTLADAGGAGRGFIAADLDGDGREEIYLLNGGDPHSRDASRDRLFAAFGQRWMDLLDLPENAANAKALSGAGGIAIDRHGHGRYGFLIFGGDGVCHLFELGPRGYLIDTGDDLGFDSGGDATAATLLPQGDHATNVFVGVVGGPNRLFRIMADGGFEEMAAERGLGDPKRAPTAVCAFDADGDGLFDLLTIGTDEPPRLLLQRPGLPFLEGTSPDLGDVERADNVLVADFDNDGHQEIFLRRAKGPNRMFGWRHGEWREMDIGDASEAGLGGGGAVAIDLDGDGRLELLLAHGGGAQQPLTAYRAFPNPNNWLRIAPLTAHGAPARGAIVTCVAGGRRQSRIIDAASGRLCQMEPVAHFGLGDAKQVEHVDIRWPDGTAVVIDAPPINRAITVPYPPE